MASRQFEDQAEQIARRMARETASHAARPGGRQRPPDAGSIGQLRETVRAAHEAGRESLMLEVAEAWELYTENDDLNLYVETLTGLMPAEWWAARNRAKEGH